MKLNKILVRLCPLSVKSTKSSTQTFGPISALSTSTNTATATSLSIPEFEFDDRHIKLFQKHLSVYLFIFSALGIRSESFTKKYDCYRINQWIWRVIWFLDVVFWILAHFLSAFVNNLIPDGKRIVPFMISTQFFVLFSIIHASVYFLQRPGKDGTTGSSFDRLIESKGLKAPKTDIETAYQLKPVPLNKTFLTCDEYLSTLEVILKKAKVHVLLIKSIILSVTTFFIGFGLFLLSSHITLDFGFFFLMLGILLFLLKALLLSSHLCLEVTIFITHATLVEKLTEKVLNAKVPFDQAIFFYDSIVLRIKKTSQEWNYFLICLGFIGAMTIFFFFFRTSFGIQSSVSYEVLFIITQLAYLSLISITYFFYGKIMDSLNNFHSQLHNLLVRCSFSEDQYRSIKDLIRYTQQSDSGFQIFGFVITSRDVFRFIYSAFAAVFAYLSSLVLNI